jgi:hypothetical protein
MIICNVLFSFRERFAAYRVSSFESSLLVRKIKLHQYGSIPLERQGMCVVGWKLIPFSAEWAARANDHESPLVALTEGARQ